MSDFTEENVSARIAAYITAPTLGPVESRRSRRERATAAEDAAASIEPDPPISGSEDNLGEFFEDDAEDDAEENPDDDSPDASVTRISYMVVDELVVARQRKRDAEEEQDPLLHQDLGH